MHQKTVLIIGCSSGIGRSTALDFLDEEWGVYTTIRNPADIETLRERDASIAALDVIDQEGVDRVIDHIVDEQGRVNRLINNAGYSQMGPAEDVPIEKVYDQLDMDVYGSHRLIHTVLPHMRSQSDSTVVDVSSVAGHVVFPGTSVCVGSKFTLEAMTDTLRIEVRGYGIDTVLTEPGPIETRFSNRVEAEVSGNGDEADDLNRSGAYEKLYKLFDDLQALGGSDPSAIPPERVAGDIVNAVSSTKPRVRCQPGTVARVGVLACFSPDAWHGALYGFARKLP